MTMTKRGKMNGFRTMLGAMAIAAMTMVGCGANTGADDGAADSGNASVNEEIEIGMESTLNLEEPYEIGINGRAICLPSTVDKFLNQYPEFTVEYELEDVRTEYMGGINLYDADTGNYVGEIFTYYKDCDEHAFKDEYVYWVHFERLYLESTGTKVEFYGGLNFESTSEEFIEVLGEPTMKTELEDCVIYRWDNNPYELMGDDWELIETSFYFVDGKLDEVYIKHETNESRFR